SIKNIHSTAVRGYRSCLRNKLPLSFFLFPLVFVFFPYATGRALYEVRNSCSDLALPKVVPISTWACLGPQANRFQGSARSQPNKHVVLLYAVSGRGPSI
ncbi:hypothetical protein BKA67DRAFT_569447, partial [Truncatella angustata]